MSVRIVYQDIAAGAAEDAGISTASSQPFCSPQQLPLAGESIPLASLEPNSWLLDGSREIVNGQPVRFWSAAMSGAEGVFENPPEIQIDFDARYTSPGIFLRFDEASGEYCPSVTVQWRRGPSLLAEETFAPDGTAFFCSRTVEAYDRITLRLNETSLPYRYAKLSQIVFGVTRVFLRNELRDVKITAETSILSTEIAVNTLDFTLDSSDRLSYMFQFKQPVSAYDGDRLTGVFYISSSTRRAAGVYDVSCIDAIGVLDEDRFPAAVYNAYPAKSLLEDILGGHFDLLLDAALSTADVTGYIPDCTRREALQQVAFALCAIVDTSGTAAVRVYKDRENTPFRFPLSRIYTGGSVETAAIVTAVRVTAHIYRPGGSGSDTVQAGGETYDHITETAVIHNPKATASDKQNVVEIDGATLINPGNAAAVTQHVYDYYAKRDRQRIKILLNGEQPGDRIAAPTPWGTIIHGYITRMDMVLSGVAAADCEIVGEETGISGNPEARFSGEFFAGEV